MSCALNVYGTRAPTSAYAMAAAKLLFGIAAQESDGFRAVRQYGFTWQSDVGAFGLWQVEQGSMADSLAYLQKHFALASRSADWLYQWEHAAPNWYANIPIPIIARLSIGWHRLSCLLARVHLLRRPEPIPSDLEGQAAYWKRWYNTPAGAGTVEQYMEHWRHYAKPVLHSLEMKYEPN